MYIAITVNQQGQINPVRRSANSYETEFETVEAAKKRSEQDFRQTNAAQALIINLESAEVVAHAGKPAPPLVWKS